MGSPELEARIAALQAELDALRRTARERQGVGAPTARAGAAVRSWVAERTSCTGSWTWHFRTDTIVWSDDLYTILGLDREVVSPSAEGFFGAIHEEDRERVQQVASTSLETGAPATIAFRVARPDGVVRRVTMQAALIHGEAGEREYLVGTVSDDTEYLHTQELLAHTIDELNEAQRIAGVGSFRSDQRSGTLEWSGGMFRILGVPITTVPTHELFWSLVHPEDLPRLRELEALDQGATDLPPVEFRVKRADGVVRQMHLITLVLRDASGTVTGHHGTLQDVTDQRILEAKLMQSQKMEAVGRLAGGIAHDFNNYLMVITGHADLLRALAAGDKAMLKSVDAVEDVAARCAHLTQQLLTFGKRHRVQSRNVDMRELIARLLPMLSTALGETIQLRVELEEGPSVVVADRSQIEQVVMNLCFNARDAMPDGGTLRLCLDTVFLADSDVLSDGDVPAAMVQLSVIDTGCGIPNELHSRIFEPFFTTKGFGKGTGLGLATTYGIVRGTGGSIEVESELGEGTTFRVRFPRGSGAVPDDSDAELVLQSVPARDVLVVEDVGEVRDLLCRQLMRAGYHVRAAENGVAALEMLQERPSDVVVSDVVMPQMGGVELAGQVRERHPRTACILVTGYSSDTLGPQELPCEVLHKPFSVRQLVAAIEAAAASLAAPAVTRSGSP